MIYPGLFLELYFAKLGGQSLSKDTSLWFLEELRRKTPYFLLKGYFWFKVIDEPLLELKMFDLK